VNEKPINELLGLVTKKKRQVDKIVTSSLYEILSVIKAWRRRPSEFGICEPIEDIEFMIAHDRTDSDIYEVLHG
jgi:hypothetical protein